MPNASSSSNAPKISSSAGCALTGALVATCLGVVAVRLGADATAGCVVADG